MTLDNALDDYSAISGDGSLDLFPAWDVNHIAIAATWDPVISDDGSKVCFRHDLLSLYLGELNPVAPVSPTPVIHGMAFDPSYMVNSDPSARVTLTSLVSDPNVVFINGFESGNTSAWTSTVP